MKKILFLILILSISKLTILESSERFGLHHDISRDGGKEEKEFKEITETEQEEKAKKEASKENKRIRELCQAYPATTAFIVKSFAKKKLPTAISRKILDLCVSSNFKLYQVIKDPIMQDPAMNRNRIYSIIKLNENEIAVGCKETIKILHKEKDKDGKDKWICKHILEGHNYPIRSLIKLNEDEIVSSSSDGTIRIWNKEKDKDYKDNWTCIHVIQEDTQEVFSLIQQEVFSLIQLNENEIASGSKDGTIRIWHKEKDKDGKDKWICKHVLNDHIDCVYSLIKLNENEIASGSADGTIRIWKKEKDEQGQDKWICKQILQYGNVFQLIKLNDNEIAATIGGIAIFKRLTDTHEWKYDQSLHIPGIRISGMASVIKLNDNKIAAGYYDNTLRIWHREKDNNGKDKWICKNVFKNKSSYCIIKLTDDEIMSVTSGDSIRILKRVIDINSKFLPKEDFEIRKRLKKKFVKLREQMKEIVKNKIIFLPKLIKMNEIWPKIMNFELSVEEIYNDIKVFEKIINEFESSQNESLSSSSLTATKRSKI